jgi:hypothetical protein
LDFHVLKENGYTGREKLVAMKETADSSGLKPLGMTKHKGFAMAHLKVRPFKSMNGRVFQQPV